MVDGDPTEAGGSRQRVVVVLQYALAQGAGRCLHLDGAAHGERTLSAGLHGDAGAVQQVDTIVSGVGLVLQGRPFIGLPRLGLESRRSAQQGGGQGSSCFSHIV